MGTELIMSGLTHADIKSMLEQRRATLATMHRQMLVADEWIHADEDPSPIVKYIDRGFPRDHQWQVDSYAWTVLNRLVNQVSGGNAPQVTYELPKSYHRKEKKAKEHEKAIQAWAQGILYHIAYLPENPFQDMLYQQLGPGLGALSSPLDYEGWGKPPENNRQTPEEEEEWEAFELRRSQRIPWRVESLHPTWIFFDTAHNPPEDYIIEKPVSMRAMATQFPSLGLRAEEQNDQATAKYVEYCSATEYGCWVNGEPVTPNPKADAEGIAPNGLGHTWVSLAWSGLGKLDSTAAWHRRGVGMIQRGIGDFKALTFDDNFLNLVKRSMVPKYVATNPDGREAAEEETQDIDPLSPSVIALGKTTFRPLENLDIPAAIVQDIQERKAGIAQKYGPGVLSGEYQSEPASKFASRLEQARAPVRASKKNSEQAIAVSLMDMLWDVKHEPDLEDGVAVSYRKGAEGPWESVELKPDQAVLGGRFVVDMSPLTPEEKAFKVEDAAQKEANGWWGKERAMKAGGEIDDTVEEMSQIAADRIMASPEFIGFQTMEVVIPGLRQKLGIPDPAIVAQEQAALGGGMPQQQGGGAPLPPDVPVAPGPPLAGGQEAAQRVGSMFAPPPVAGSNGRY